MRRPDRLGIQTLKDDVFQMDAVLVAGPVDQFLTWIRRRYDEPDIRLNHPASLGRVLIHKWEGGSREWVMHFPTLRPDPTTIVHESVHLALDVLEHRGVTDSETMCYYTETIFRQVTAALARWRKQGRR
jgi:hypothetical protein